MSEVRLHSYLEGSLTSLTLAFLVITFTVFTIVMRLLDHAPNFTPVAGLALFSGVYVSKRWGFSAPLAALLASDFVIGFYDWRIMASVYGSFLATVAIGWFARRTASLSSIFIGSLSGSLLFYIVTNFAVWLFSGMYPHTAQGFLSSYIMALPFFRNTLSGDLFYTAVFFGTYVVAVNLFLFWRLNRNRGITMFPLFYYAKTKRQTTE